jgi:phage terminase large subunit-like protein
MAADHPRVAEGIAYAEQVLAGAIPACRFVHLACSRFLRDLGAAVAGRGRWAWRPDLAERALGYAACCPNIKGPQAGKPLQVMPWQAFVFGNLFGFVERGTTHRRFRQGVVYVPRGNGKTTLAAPIALYLTFALTGRAGPRATLRPSRATKRESYSTPRPRWYGAARRSKACAWQTAPRRK